MNYNTDEFQTAVAQGEHGHGGSLFALLEAARSVQERLESALEAVELSPAKFQALDALVRAGKPLALSELAGCLKCVRSNVTQLADRLESDGLVKRVDDPADRRAIHAVVTPIGIERHAAGAAAIAELQLDLARRIPSSEREAFLKVLTSLS
jgi:DNA-binding MarR family transcriptional regulator